MKRMYCLGLLSVVVVGCGGKEEPADVKKTISGTYVRQSESEYSKAMDTLVVTPYDEKAGTFLLIRRTGFHRIKEGKLQPKESKQQRMIAVWDEETHQLQELQEGKLYTFPITGHELLAGTSAYQKIQ